MASEGRRQWGLSAPISMAPPEPKDLILNQALLDYLQSQNNFETPEETEKRKKVLALLQTVVEEFVRHVCRHKGLAPSVIESAGGKVSTFGSYRLGVYGPGSDIDTLVIAPKDITRDDFFEHFPATLEKMSAPGAIDDINIVKDAHVPIIKLEHSKIDLDIIFCRLEVHSVPKTLDLNDTSLLRGLKDEDVRSINGTRVTDRILQLVPEAKPFRHALRAIKLWAQRRAIYANIVGFPGGVAWAMLVARVCQLYPKACGAVLVAKFFLVMSTWNWPKPVLLQEEEQGPLANVRLWNPVIYKGDSFHLMPIITPAYPSMCSTHNVTRSTKTIIIKELERGRGIATNILAGKATWQDLFVKHTFFTKDYKYYLSVVAGGRTKKAAKEWSGLVESKVRRLVSFIEVADTGVQIAHPFNKGFERAHLCKSETEIDAVFQGQLQYQIDAERAAEIETKASGEEKSTNGETLIYTTTFYIGLELGGGDGGRRLDISRPVTEFGNVCYETTIYDKDIHTIRTVHTRSYDLPLDCFEPGEKRPERPTKSKKKKVANGSAPSPAPSASDTRKRGAEGQSLPSSKKLNLDANEPSAGLKRALDQEVRTTRSPRDMKEGRPP